MSIYISDGRSPSSFFTAVKSSLLLVIGGIGDCLVLWRLSLRFAGVSEERSSPLAICFSVCAGYEERLRIPRIPLLAFRAAGSRPSALCSDGQSPLRALIALLI
ncbi:hypothetical protein NDU88_001514 [Pleurodeles waltl]|uniref:Uncharacterized protein n=1 Tax=Pleurodeles waltl TaxID=8319 RepID=A0AAV7S892_PLEWA|nr:hypothetical protein NDU88_001514 [Pleurodeles waltl]